MFIRPSASKLQSYSACLLVKAGTFNISYLKQRAEHLEEREHLVRIMIDKVYTAKHIEYSNGTFVGVTEEGEPAKTVLA